MVFGSGTKLRIISSEEYKPSFYKLESGDTKVCLATGFSRHNATEEESYKNLFIETKATLISGDSLYNQVAWLSSEDDGQCEKDGESGQCGDTFKPDPTVNFMSLTVLGLRLLFLKTIVFNVLMTFRLWISQ
ncbi:M1-specific T cell receptor alpha chain-like [Chaetodon trifascialis]|uniref:M1-specific T cell receptor alpha chain-like n=1 Tax=Chaetodon trifascialis TaxID=109706 RepID=UPI003991AB8B